MSRQTKLSAVHRDNLIKYNLSFIKFILKAPRIYTHTGFLRHRRICAPPERQGVLLMQVPMACCSPRPWLQFGLPSAFSHQQANVFGWWFRILPGQTGTQRGASRPPAIPTSLFSLLKTICGQFSPSPKITRRCRSFFLEGNENLTAFCCILSPGPANH